jgi:hypothetical protein
MGRSVLIVLFGFATSFGILSYGKNNRMVESVDRMANRFSEYSAKNAAASGAYMALNQLFLNPGWRTGYDNLVLSGETVSVNVQDVSDDASLGPYRIRILASGQNPDTTSEVKVEVFDGAFHEFAVWAKDSVTRVITTDSAGVVDLLGNLVMEKAPYMPEINRAAVEAEAAVQGNTYNGNFTPNDDYPNADFFAYGSMPNVTHVEGDLRVNEDRTVYGIFLVEGDVVLEEGSRLRGVLYVPNASSTITHEGNHDISRVRGGVVTWGTMDGNDSYIVVRHYPSYLHALVSNFAPDNPPMRVVSWK